MAKVGLDTKVLRNCIFGISALQFFSFLWASWLIVRVNNGMIPDHQALGAVFPVLLFALFGAMNTIFVIVYVVLSNKQKKKISKPAVLLASLLILSMILAAQVFEYIESIKLG